MKKIMVVVLALAVVLVCFAACGGKTNTDANTSSDAQVETTEPAETTEDTADQGTAQTGTIEAIYEDIYAIAAPEFGVMTMPVDLTDAETVTYMTGISDASVIKQAYTSESMMGAQAYSFIIVELAEGADAESVKKEMFEGINPAKWICVEADQITVASSGSYVALAMVSSELTVDLDADLIDAFSQVVGALEGETLSK